jgi:two-component system, chemotaxis family, chemotaxis protein CheY
MPVMDGWTFLARMRERPDLASLPVLVMSAGHRASEEAAARGVRCIPKPLCMVALVEQVARAARAVTSSIFPRALLQPVHDRATSTAA